MISSFVERLQCQIPSDSRIKLMLLLNGSGFCGKLSIASKHLNFNIEFIEDQISGVIAKLSEQSESKIQIWLQERLFAS